MTSCWSSAINILWFRESFIVSLPVRLLGYEIGSRSRFRVPVLSRIIPPFDDPAVGDLNHPIAVTGVHLRVRHLNDGGSRLVQALEEFHNVFALPGMQVARRLVRENNFGFGDDGARHPDQLLM